MDNRTLLISSEQMGHGDAELGAKLMGSFLRKLWALETKPVRVVFYNSGVKLLAQGSPVLDALDGLYQAGVDLIACGTCAAHFDLKDKIAVGRVSDMQEIATIMMTSPAAVTV